MNNPIYDTNTKKLNRVGNKFLRLFKHFISFWSMLAISN